MIITYEFVVFKLLSYCFEETIGFDLKVSFVRRSVSRLIKPSDLTKGYSVPRGFPLGWKLQTDIVKCIAQISTHNTAKSFGKFG